MLNNDVRNFIGRNQLRLLLVILYRLEIITYRETIDVKVNAYAQHGG